MLAVLITDAAVHYRIQALAHLLLDGKALFSCWMEISASGGPMHVEYGFNS